MATNTLKNIIAVEKEIQQTLDAEQKSTAAWLDRHREEIEADIAHQLASLKASGHKAQEEAQSAAAKQAAAILRQAAVDAERLAALSDAALEPQVWAHIASIGTRKQ